MEPNNMQPGTEPVQTHNQGQDDVRIIGEMPRNLLEAITYGGILLLIVVLLITGDGAINSVLPTLGVFAFAGLKIFPAVQQMYQSLTTLRANAPTLEAIHKEYMAAGTGV